MANNGCIDADLTKLTVTQLKDFLRKRGQPVSGNKSELISRVEGSNKLGLVDLNVVREEDKKQQRSRDQSKLTTPLSETLPHPRDLKNWTKDLNFVPNFSHNEIYNYLVLTMNSKKQMKSKVFYEDGHVHSIEINNVNENISHCYVKARVLPSLPTANKKDSPDYDVWVMMSNVTGCVNSAECNCTAGEGESCNHIAALLYAISDISTKRKEGKLAPTSSKCKWNNPRKRKLSPKKAEEMTFKKYSFKSQPPSVKRIKMQDTGQCSVNIARFRQKLIQNHSSAGWLTNFSAGRGTCLRIPVLPVLHTVIFQYSDVVDFKNQTCQDMFKKYFEQLQITEKDCATIECLTRQQSDCAKWKIAREERITASNFGKVAKQKVCTPPDSILKDLLGYRVFDSAFLRYGRSHEKAARRTYTSHMRKSHPGLSVKDCGLFVNIKYPHLGASPDGLVYCPCSICKSTGYGLVEIKCPASMKWRMLSPQECAKDPHFFCKINDDGNVVLKTGHSYFYQVQGQMAVTKRKWCDFVVWTCSGKISVERITFDPNFWEEMLRKLNHFYVDSVIPELFSSRVLRGLPLFR